jgi:hypothetical protein
MPDLMPTSTWVFFGQRLLRDTTQLVADMIAPTPGPGHLADMAMDDNGILLICDSRADRIYQFDTRKRELMSRSAL